MIIRRLNAFILFIFFVFELKLFAHTHPAQQTQTQIATTFIKCIAVTIHKNVKNQIEGKNYSTSRAEIVWLTDIYAGNWFTDKRNVKNNFFQVLYNQTKNVRVNETIIKQECQKKLLPEEYNLNQIKIAAQEGSFGSQFPVIDINTKISSDSFPKLNYGHFLEYAQASDYVYSIEKGSSQRPVEMPNGFMEYDRKVYSNSPSYLHVMTFINLNEKRAIISFKGSSNKIDAEIDAQLLNLNLNYGYSRNLAYALFDSYNYVNEMIEKFKTNGFSDFEIILTGHSLGAFLASVTSVQTGLKARVFCSPATYLSSTPGSPYSFWSNDFIPFDNVINLERQNDPVVFASGRHVEAMIYFPEASKTNIIDNHFIRPFIDDILKKIVQNKLYFNAAPYPTYMYFYGDTRVGFGLEEATNFYSSY